MRGSIRSTRQLLSRSMQLKTPCHSLAAALRRRRATWQLICSFVEFALHRHERSVLGGGEAGILHISDILKLWGQDAPKKMRLLPFSHLFRFILYFILL